MNDMTIDLQPGQIHPDHVADHPDAWVCDYEGAEPTYWETKEAARGDADETIRFEAGGRQWDWWPDEETGGEVQWWTDDLDDRPLAQAPGRILPLAGWEG